MRTLTYIFTTLGTILCIWSIASCKLGTNEAVQYNDQLVEMQGSLLQSVAQLEDSFEDYEASLMDSTYRSLMSTIQSSKAELEALGIYEGDSTLYLAARKLLDEYEQLTTTEYAELISYLKIPDSLYTVEDQERSFELLSEVTEKRQYVHDAFIEAQKSFGAEHGFTFIDDVNN